VSREGDSIWQPFWCALVDLLAWLQHDVLDWLYARLGDAWLWAVCRLSDATDWRDERWKAAHGGGGG
jgi:hypothetical protein